jgi:SAM-dependent methyltransferase
MGEEWPVADLFDEDYLRFYASRVADEVSDADVAVICQVLGLAGGADVLDLGCGHGRIANRLAATGARVTGLDVTPMFLDRARRDAHQLGVTVDYVEGDMRSIPWADRFDVVVSWFTAYGYFDDDQNRKVLSLVHRALKPRGRFLVELNHKDGLLPHWLPATVEEGDGAIMIDRRVFDPLTGRSNARRTIIKDGQARESFYFTRMFSFTELRDWLLRAGFSAVSGFAGDGSELVQTSRRMILVAEK